MQIIRYIKYVQQYISFRKKCARLGRPLPLFRDRYVCLGDDTKSTSYDRHYLYHTAWAARMVNEQRPTQHVDIGSYLYFSSIVSAFIPTKFFDYRPPKLELSGLEVGFQDLLNLDFKDNSIESLSCMHVIEHVGLGRYGDLLDPVGDIKAMAELARVIKIGGYLYLVVPVGRARTCFNAHRIYSFEIICNYFKEFELEQFSLIPDTSKQGHIISNANQELVDSQEYGCGCFLFKKTG